MQRKLWSLLLVGAATLALLATACGDDDSDTSASKDGGPNDPSPDAGGDTGTDGGCTFAGYVIGLVNTETTAKALPTANLGENCTPSTSQADFATLFP